MTYTPGSLVRARGREWIVLPESVEDFLVLRPLAATDDEVTGISIELEKVEPAHFDLPNPDQVGDHRSCRLLRDAIRLSTRAGAGPFRSLGRIAVEPRPYQLVPLLMALRLEPVRLLIADDVGIGKTIEAALVARELLDRAEVRRLAVLCPPALAEQWQAELRNKFHIDAELVLPGTAARLERGLGINQSIFEVYPYVVVSMDYIKAERRRTDFVRTCPELVIVDEAHTCAFGADRSGRHQRHEMVKQLSADKSRHLILVTATPHSGKEDAFRSLLGLLRDDFVGLPDDLAGLQNESRRRQVAAHFVQRRRADIRRFLDADTPFPEREEKEETYKLSPEYRKLFERVLAYAREIVRDPIGGQHRQRVRWWSALALLRSLASSPAAAAATLRNRAPAADTESPDEADEIGRRTVLDLDADDAAEIVDVAPGADSEADEGGDSTQRRRLLDMARQAEQLQGDLDLKLLNAVKHIEALLKGGFRPIVFCRFIPTAHYVARELGDRLPKAVQIMAVTGELPPAERETRILELAAAPRRVLVATDCLSEGINLQEHFDAVMHYDLSWSPTRHEQREGRVDRYGQGSKKVRVLTYYGVDNRIDGLVLDVLLRKHITIRNSLGISVPVPGDSGKIMEAIAEGLLLKESSESLQGVLPGLEEHVRPRREALHTDWENSAEREKRSRTMFAQESIKPEEVAPELAEARSSIGGADTVERFTLEALRAHGAIINKDPTGTTYRFDVSETPRALRDLITLPPTFEGRFELPVPEGVHYLSRTHPLVEGVASYVMDTALDAYLQGVARRAGAICTRAVNQRTTLLLVRFRHDLVTKRGSEETSQLAEECRLLGFTGAPANAQWLWEAAAEALLDATPDANISPEQASGFVQRVIDGYEALRPTIEEQAGTRAAAVLDAHRRVRAAAGMRGVTYRVEARLPVDVLGIYVFLPV
jgi:superfamily II DNA or RNA helicase